MLMKKSLKAFAICLGSEIELPFANLNSFGKSRFYFRRFKVLFIVCHVFRVGRISIKSITIVIAFSAHNTFPNNIFVYSKIG